MTITTKVDESNKTDHVEPNLALKNDKEKEIKNPTDLDSGSSSPKDSLPPDSINLKRKFPLSENINTGNKKRGRKPFLKNKI